MSGNFFGSSVITQNRSTHAGEPVLFRHLLHWGMILAALAILEACDQGPSRRGGEPWMAREDQAEVTRLRDFVNLLHREIEQLQKDKQRLTEEVERLRMDNDALRAGTAKAAGVTRLPRTLSTPTKGRESP